MKKVSIAQADDYAMIATEWLAHKISIAMNQDDLQGYLLLTHQLDALTDPKWRLIIGDLLAHAQQIRDEWQVLQHKNSIHDAQTTRMPIV